MSKKGQKWVFKISNPQNFIDFLKKLKLVGKSVPLEIEGTNLFAKVRTPDKSVIKYVSVDLNEVLEGEFPPSILKIGIMELGKVIDVFKYFNQEEEIHINIDSQTYDNELIATNLKFSSSSLEIDVRCADISLLAYIDDTIQRSIHSTEGSDVSFTMSKDMFQKVSSLTGIDSSPEELLYFDIHDTGVSIRGKSFKKHIMQDETATGYTDSAVYIIYKNQFSFIDQETSEIHFHENRIVVKSLDSDSIIAIGLVEV